MIITPKKKYHSNKVIVGIDPASQGAAVVFDDMNVTAVILWKTCYRKKRKLYQVSISDKEGKRVTNVRTTSHIGNLLTNLPCLAICNGIAIEDTYFGKNVKTTIMLSRMAGTISSPLEVKCGFPATYVQPHAWRKAVLNVKGRLKRDLVKEISLTKIPKICPSLQPHLEVLGEHDHITDAAGIGLWLYKKYDNIL